MTVLDGFVPWPDRHAADYRRRGLWLGVPLGDLLHDAFQKYADRTAVVCDDRRMTYRELSDSAERLASGLIAMGLRPLDRVVVQLPNVPELVTLLVALLRTGVIPVLALPGHRSAEIMHVCEHSGAVAYVIPDRFGGFDYRQLAREIPSVPPVLVSGDPQEFVSLQSLTGDVDVELPQVDPAEPALFLLSGGTTGKPKLIPRTHDDYGYVMRTTAAASFTGNQGLTYLAVNPIAHQAALACPGVLGTLLIGGRVVLTSGVRLDEIRSLVRREGVTLTCVVPSVLRLWVDAEGAEDALRSVVVQVGSAPLDPALARQAGEVLGCTVMRWYGISEGLLTHARLGDPEKVALYTEGRPMSPDDEVRVVNAAGGPVPDGEAGEMQVRGPYTICGYFRAPEENARSFTPDGYFRTGDLVRRTSEGDITIVGRVKEVINRAGEKVVADEVERHLRAHPDVRDAVVVGAQDAVLGERTYAFVVASTGDVRDLALKEFLRGRGLATYKIPDRVVCIDEVPRTPMGKADKKELRILAARQSR